MVVVYVPFPSLQISPACPRCPHCQGWCVLLPVVCLYPPVISSVPVGMSASNSCAMPPGNPLLSTTLMMTMTRTRWRTRTRGW